MKNFLTPVVPLVNISKMLHKSNIFFKLESVNPVSHTFKDRGALSTVIQVQKEKKSLILAGTCSNMGVAISGMASKYGIDSIVIVSSSAPVGMITMIKKFSKKAIVIPGGFDEVNSFISEISDEFPDIPCVNSNFNKYFFDGYFSIIDELYIQLDHKQVYHIVVPTADGTLISSLYKRYQQISKKKKIAQLIFHLVQPAGCSPIVNAIHKNEKIKMLYDSYTKVIPLSVKNPSLYGERAKEAVIKTGGSGIKICENEIDNFTNMLINLEGLYSDKVGGVLLGAIFQLSKKVKKNENILGIYTGNGLVYAGEGSENQIESLKQAKNHLYQLLENKNVHKS